MSTIKLQIPKGFRDFLPSKKRLRQKIIDVLREVFEIYGFEPLETPCLEYAETLEGKYGEDADRLIYKFEDRGGRKVALRYDLTIPLCRVVSMYPEITKPFKCYQIAPVWRADKPQRGRFREFYQCDVDTIGTDSMMADAELLAITATVLYRIGLSSFTIRINNRKLLNALAESAGIAQDKVPTFLRSLDKLDKVGTEGVYRELTEKNFYESTVKKALSIIDAAGHEGADLAEMKRVVGGVSVGEEGIRELQVIEKALEAQGVPKECYRFDLSLARGLDYYTGPIFETVVEHPRIGSITGGGRYDNLIGLFSKKFLPATGTSFGLERLITVMEEMEKDDLQNSSAQVLLVFFAQNLMTETLKIAKMLRDTGLKTQVYFNLDKLKKQLSYAFQKGIPFVVILGPDEVKEGTVVLRNMALGTQEKIAQGDLVTRIKHALRGNNHKAAE
jgi:histidyl-tRNA synthetase